MIKKFNEFINESNNLNNISDSDIYSVWRSAIGGTVPTKSVMKKDILELMKRDGLTFQEIKQALSDDGLLEGSNPDSKTLNKEIGVLLKDLFSKKYPNVDIESYGKFYEFHLPHESDKKLGYHIEINYAKKQPDVKIKLTDFTGEDVKKSETFKFNKTKDLENIFKKYFK
jgi:hypothetical protein